MRYAALVGLASFALAPLDAEACTQFVGILGVSPDGAALPANARLLVIVSSTRYPLDAHWIGASGPVPLPTQAIGPNHFALDLLGAPSGAELELAIPGFGSSRTFTIGEILAQADTAAPTAPADLEFSVEYFPFSRCVGPGLVVQGALTPGTDDLGVVGHEIARVFPDGHEEVMGIELLGQAHQPDGAFNLYIDVAAEPDADEQYCFAARAIDRAGHRSEAFVAGDCADAPEPDAGFIDSGVERDGGVIVPDAGSRDAGVRDGGSASIRDGGAPHDSGFGGGPLDEAGSNCGCTATHRSRTSWGWLFAALIFARRRRVSSACR